MGRGCQSGDAESTGMNREKLLRRTKHQLASGLKDSAGSVPGTQDSACSKRRNVGSTGKLFVSQFKDGSLRGLATKAIRERHEDLGKPLLGTVGNHACMGSD